MYKYHDQLETDRLTTRFLTQEDILPWSAFFADEEAIKFFPDLQGDSGLDKSKHWIERQFSRYRENTYGLQALIRKETREFVGQCGLLIQEVDGLKETEVSYHILKKYWGNGYAPEAARLFINYAFSEKLTDSVISIIDTGNRKSQRVAEKNGLTVDKVTRHKELEVFIYRISREQFF
jgi:[ribosomal protein S5]-alanine N-acetyltransferase